MGSWYQSKDNVDILNKIESIKQDVSSTASEKIAQQMSEIDKVQSQKIEEIEKKFLAYIDSTNKVINSYSDYSVREITKVRKDIYYLTEDLSYLTEKYENLSNLVLKHRELIRKETSIIYLLIVASIIINGIACLLR